MVVFNLLVVFWFLFIFLACFRDKNATGWTFVAICGIFRGSQIRRIRTPPVLIFIGKIMIYPRNQGLNPWRNNICGWRQSFMYLFHRNLLMRLEIMDPVHSTEDDGRFSQPFVTAAEWERIVNPWNYRKNDTLWLLPTRLRSENVS